MTFDLGRAIADAIMASAQVVFEQHGLRDGSGDLSREIGNNASQPILFLIDEAGGIVGDRELEAQSTRRLPALVGDPPRCQVCKKEPDPKPVESCYDCREIVSLHPSKRGVWSCPCEGCKPDIMTLTTLLNEDSEAGNEARRRMMAPWCRHCGVLNPSCRCWDDE